MWSHLSRDQETLMWLGAASAAMFVGSLVILPFVMVRMREDYFMPPGELAGVPARRHPLLCGMRLVLKNLLGILLVLAGATMLVLPGQGILTIMFGMAFLNFPGKRALELRLVRLGGVHRAIDAVRARYGRPPLRLPAPNPPPDVAA